MSQIKQKKKKIEVAISCGSVKRKIWSIKMKSDFFVENEKETTYLRTTE